MKIVKFTKIEWTHLESDKIKLSEDSHQCSKWCKSGVISKNHIEKALFFKEKSQSLTIPKQFSNTI